MPWMLCEYLIPVVLAAGLGAGAALLVGSRYGRPRLGVAEGMVGTLIGLALSLVVCAGYARLVPQGPPDELGFARSLGGLSTVVPWLLMAGGVGLGALIAFAD